MQRVYVCAFRGTQIVYGALQTRTHVNAHNIRQLKSAADAAAQRAAAEEGMLRFSGMFSLSLSLSRARSPHYRCSAFGCLGASDWHGAQMLGREAVVLKVKRERAHARERARESIIYFFTLGFRY